jgi:hypothetical protein
VKGFASFPFTSSMQRKNDFLEKKKLPKHTARLTATSIPTPEIISKNVPALLCSL